MANRELPIHIRQLYQKLKQKFPDVPDNVIFKYAKMYPDDIQKCIDYLNEHKNMQIEDENRTVGNKNQLPDSYNSYIQGSVLINQAPFQLPNNGIVEGHAGINGISSLPYITVQGTGTNAAYHSKYGHSPGARSSSVSGATLMPPTTSEYRSSVTGTQSQSAPVMPSHYEPFQMEYKGHAEVSFKPTLIRSPGQISFTPISTHRFPQSHEIYYEQLNRQHLPYSQYKYEMRVQYNQGMSYSSGLARCSFSTSAASRVQSCVNNNNNVCVKDVIRSPPVRHVTSLNVTPINPQAGFFQFGSQSMTAKKRVGPRTHSTSINLHLRPPSSTLQPQIQINTSGGSVTYSAKSGDGQHPFKSHFCISFTPLGGSFSAIRTYLHTHPDPKTSVQSQCRIESIPSNRVFRPTTGQGSESCCRSSALSFPSDFSFSPPAHPSFICDHTCSRSPPKFPSHKPSLLQSSSVPRVLDCNNMGLKKAAQVPSQYLLSSSPALNSTNVQNTQRQRNCQDSSLDMQKDFSFVQALIQCQQAQMAKLREHLMGEKQKLDLIKSDVYALEEELQKRKRCLQNPIIPLDIIEQLREETRKLRIECDTMSKEVDSLVKGKVPLGETRMDFYESINPGQVGNVGIPLNRQERSSKALSSVSLPPPPPPLIRNEDEDRQWSCSTCTFLNNIALDKCEICDMPRLSLASNFT